MSNVLAAPIKSSNDKREYRTIQLENGLKALLISDLSLQNEPETDDESEMDESGSEDDESSEDNEMERDEDNSEAQNSPKQTEKLAAAGLCIGVGSFSDPDDVPGLAHFLEHMVFMGSDKYPAENGFDSLIKRCGGSDNAETDCERTVFYFDVHTKHFHHALDHFAQFFICPLLKMDSMEREMQSVDSEFQMSLNSDAHRKQQLLASLTKDGHPMKKFMWGNLKTLKYDPNERKIDVYSKLKEFWKNHYSAQFMTLVVQSRETLDTLESWVKEIFSKVPNNGLAPFTFERFSRPFDDPSFTKFYKIIPVKNTHQVELTWSLPSLRKHYKIKPHCYISWLIGHEGKGSILSYLKSKIWALSLYSGNDETGFEHNSTHASFGVTVGLTEEGLDNLFSVITTVFQYIQMLRKNGADARIYEEIKNIEESVFRWKDETDATDYVQNLCENMQIYPPEHYICGDQLMFEFDSKVIEDVQNMLLPDNCNIAVMSHRFEKDFGDRKIEKWFKTQYFESEIDQNWIESWKNLQPNPKLHLPEINKFIATNFDMKKADFSASEYPIKIIDDEQSCLWYKKDIKFNVPKAYVYFHLITPLVNASPQNSSLLDIFVNVLAQNLAEAVYPADVAQLFYNIYGNETGLVVQVHGFNQNLYMLLETILNYMDEFSVNKDLFEAVKKHLIKQYYNKFIKPSKLCADVGRSLVQQQHWTCVDKRDAILNTNSDMLCSFVRNFKNQLFVEGLIQGNVTAAEAFNYLNLVKTKLKCRKISRHLLPEIRVMKLGNGEKFCSVKGFNLEDNNSVVTNYYQSGPGNVHDCCLMEVLIALMEEPCFDVLRTQQQLGYSVYCMVRYSFGIIGFSVTVESQVDKFSVEEIDERIESFLTHFQHKLHTEITDKEFETQVTSLIKLKSCVDLRLKEEVNRNWNEIIHGNYLFNRQELEIQHLKKITLEEVREWYKNHLKSEEKFSKLGIQVVGNQSKPTETDMEHHNQSPKKLIQDDWNKMYELKFLKGDLKTENAHISDIFKYKQNLSIFPVIKIVK